MLARLVEQRVLDRLERRQGGAGGGSSAWVYALGPAGVRMVAYWAGEGLPRSRGAHEPGAAWTAHTLAVSELYVRLREAERAGRVELLAFDAEPACWRRYTRLGGAAGVLKPDAYVRLGIGEYEDSFLVEVDLGTEHRGQLTRQHHAYGEYFRSGVEQAKTGVFPRCAVDRARRAAGGAAGGHPAGVARAGAAAVHGGDQRTGAHGALRPGVGRHGGGRRGVSATTDGRPVMYGDPARWLLLHADCLALLPELPANSVEAVITDPPYGIGFGGEAWDGGKLTDAAAFQRWTTGWAAEALRVLKPGGWLAAFGAPRTAHRLVAGVEDAGFEVRDTCAVALRAGRPEIPPLAQAAWGSA